METMKLNICNNGKPFSLSFFIMLVFLSALQLSMPPAATAQQIPSSSASSFNIPPHIEMQNSAAHASIGQPQKAETLPTNQISCPASAAASSSHETQVNLPAPGMKVNEDPEVKLICQKTLNPDFCMATIGPLVSGKPDVMTMFQLATKAAVEQAKVSLAFISKFTPPAGSNSMEKQLVVDCKVNYNDLLDNLQKVMEALSKSDIGSLNNLLSAAISDLTTCEDGFQDRPFQFPLTQFHEKLRMMVSNCLAMSKLLH